MAQLLYYIYLFPLLASALLSLKSWWFRWPRPFRFFSVFLVSTLGVELLAIAWKWGLNKTDYWTYNTTNLWIYNGFIPLRYLFLLLFFHGIITARRIRYLIRWCIPLLTGLSLLNYFFIQQPHHVNTYSIISCYILLSLLPLAYFRQVLKAPQLINLRRTTEVWIALGTFVYHLGTLPLFICFDYLTTQYPDAAISYFYINDALNILMYFSYLISFLCRPQYHR